MIKGAKFQYDADAYKSQITYIEDFEDTLEEDALEAAVKLEAELLEIYYTAKPRGNETFVWSTNAIANAKARRYWFWAINSGKIQTDGNHYLRQGKPPYGAKVEVERDASNRVIISVVQTWDKSSLVFGLMREDTRIPGHKDTGWNYAGDDVNEALRNLQIALLEATLAGLN